LFGDSIFFSRHFTALNADFEGCAKRRFLNQFSRSYWLHLQRFCANHCTVSYFHLGAVTRFGGTHTKIWSNTCANRIRSSRYCHSLRRHIY